MQNVQKNIYPYRQMLGTFMQKADWRSSIWRKEEKREYHRLLLI